MEDVKKRFSRRDFLKIATAGAALAAAYELLQTPSFQDARRRLREMGIESPQTFGEDLPLTGWEQERHFNEWAQTVKIFQALMGHIRPGDRYIAERFLVLIPRNDLPPESRPLSFEQYFSLVEAQRETIETALIPYSKKPPTKEELEQFFKLTDQLREIFPLMNRTLPYHIFRGEGGSYIPLFYFPQPLPSKHYGYNFIEIGLPYRSYPPDMLEFSKFLVALLHEAIGHGSTNPWVLWYSGTSTETILRYYTELNVLTLNLFFNLCQTSNKEKILKIIYITFPPRETLQKPDEYEVKLRTRLARLHNIKILQPTIRKIAKEGNINLQYPNQGLPQQPHSYNPEFWTYAYREIIKRVLEIYAESGIAELGITNLSQITPSSVRGALTRRISQEYPSHYPETPHGMLLINREIRTIQWLTNIFIVEVEHFLTGPAQTPWEKQEEIGSALPYDPTHLSAYDDPIRWLITYVLYGEYIRLKNLSTISINASTPGEVENAVLEFHGKLLKAH